MSDFALLSRARVNRRRFTGRCGSVVCDSDRGGVVGGCESRSGETDDRRDGDAGLERAGEDDLETSASSDDDADDDVAETWDVTETCDMASSSGMLISCVGGGGYRRARRPDQLGCSADYAGCLPVAFLCP